MELRSWKIPLGSPDTTVCVSDGKAEAKERTELGKRPKSLLSVGAVALDHEKRNFLIPSAQQPSSMA